jgi:hypothetical protein
MTDPYRCRHSLPLDLDLQTRTSTAPFEAGLLQYYPETITVITDHGCPDHGSFTWHLVSSRAAFIILE